MRSPLFVPLLVVAFLLLFTYELARPAAESLFLQAYTHEGLPWVWLVDSVVIVAAVGAYNRFVGRVSAARLFLSLTILISLAACVLLIGIELGIPGAPFALYVWKDLYIVLLVESFWTIANLCFVHETARRAYGLFCAAGSLGAMTGDVAVGFVAQAVGTARGLWLTVPMMGLAGVVAWRAASTATLPPGATGSATWGETVRLLKQGRYLWLLLMLVAATQLVTNLIDYQFNKAAHDLFPGVDHRTQVVGWVYAAVNLASFILQMSAGLVVRVLGMGATLLVLPLLLGVGVIAAWFVPSFAGTAGVKVANKAFDYSLFRVAKEMLYLPLGHGQKTKSKAVIDMATYRLAKGGASVLLIGFSALRISALVPFATLVVLLAWVLLTLGIVRRYRQTIV